MKQSLLAESSITASVEHLGGIEQTSVSIPPGVTLLTGRNATNRTSLLRALMAGVGSRRCSLKGDATSGSVTLKIGDETYTRTLTRQNGTVTFDGDPYLDDPELADLYAFLLERNEARQAITRGDDLRPLIMRPVDTEAIEDEIAAVKRDRAAISEELERLETLAQELPELETKRQKKTAAYESAKADLADAQETLQEHEADVEQSREKKAELEEAFDRVREAQATLENITFDIETETATKEKLETERDRLQAELADIEVPDTSIDELTGRLTELRERERDLTAQLTELADVISFNETLLEDTGVNAPITDAPTEEGSLTDELRGESTVTCWTCGSTVEQTQIETMVDQLRELRSETFEKRSEVKSDIDAVETKRDAIEDARATRSQAEQELESVIDELETTEARLEALRDQREAQQETVKELEAAANSIDVGEHEAVIEQHQRVNRLELDVEQLETERNEFDEQIATYEDELAARDEREAEREALTAELEQLRTRIERLETDAIDAFNTHIEKVLALLEYDNLDRIWIERRTERVREGRQKVEQTRFELHVVRSGADGTAYEDTIDHLSESEREVTGLIFALAGYLVHDVADKVPVIILDSLEAIDADRIARLIEYLDNHATYLIAALLPEDAEALPDEYTYLAEIA